LGNGDEELYFNGSSGYLQRIVKLHQDISLPVQVKFGGYKSIFRESGAYLLKPDLESNIQIPFDSSSPAKLLVVEGPITSYLTSYNEPLTITTRLLNKEGQGVRVENVVDLGSTPAEVFMRIDTWLNSTSVSSQHGPTTREPTMYTDQNGYTFEKRVKVPSIGYEGNVYPVNGMAFIQDVERELVRFSFLVDR
jgi:alpha-mannosidase